MSHQSGNESDEDCYGPQLPPNFQPSFSTSHDKQSSSPSTKTLADRESKEVIGPSLPPGFKRNSSPSFSSSPHEDNSTSHADNSTSHEDNSSSHEDNSSSHEDAWDDIRVSCLDSSGRKGKEDPDEAEEDEDVIGPVLPLTGDEIDRKRGYLEPSSSSGQSIASKHEPESKDMKREEWMTVVPKKVVKKIGFKSVTSFCTKPKAANDDDDEQDEDGRKTDPSSSTTSIEKEEKVRKAYEDYTKNKRSLLDEHQESMKKVCVIASLSLLFLSVFSLSCSFFSCSYPDLYMNYTNLLISKFFRNRKANLLLVNLWTLILRRTYLFEISMKSRQNR